MLTPEESAELRGLQRRAYAPDGGLSTVDAARLRELEARRVRQAGPPAESSSTVPHTTQVDGEFGSDVPLVGTAGASDPQTPADEATAAGDSDPEPPARGVRMLLRQPWLPAAVAGVALLAGFGIGAFVNSDAITTFAVAAANAGQRADLEATEDYDPGSVVAVAEDHGAVIWRATQAQGERQCIVVTFDERSEHQCVASEDLETNGAWVVSASIPLPAEGDRARETLNASLLQDVRGRITVVTQLWSAEGWDWRSQYTPEELTVVDRLEDEGFTGQNLQILGYDGTTPVWLDYSGRLCVIVATPDRTDQACDEDGQQSVRLTVPADEGSTDYVVTETETRGPVLTIERSIPVTESGGPDAE